MLSLSKFSIRNLKNHDYFFRLKHFKSGIFNCWANVGETNSSRRPTPRSMTKYAPRNDIIYLTIPMMFCIFNKNKNSHFLGLLIQNRLGIN